MPSASFGLSSAPSGSFMRTETSLGLPKVWITGSPKPSESTLSRSLPTGAVALCSNVTRIIWPPTKSTPRLRPCVNSSTIDAAIASRLVMKNGHCQRRKWMFV